MLRCAGLESDGQPILNRIISSSSSVPSLGVPDSGATGLVEGEAGGTEELLIQVPPGPALLLPAWR